MIWLKTGSFAVDQWEGVGWISERDWHREVGCSFNLSHYEGKGEWPTGWLQSCVPTPFAFGEHLGYSLRFLWSFVIHRPGRLHQSVRQQTHEGAREKEELLRGTLLGNSFPLM